MRVSSDVSSKHLAVAFEATTGENDVVCHQVIEQTVALAYLDTSDGTSIVGQKFRRFCLPMDLQNALARLP